MSSQEKDIVIRPFKTADDLAIFSNAIVSLFQTEFLKLDLSDQEVAEIFQQTVANGGTIFIASSGDSIIGLARLLEAKYLSKGKGFYLKDRFSQDQLVIMSLVINQEYRRQGIGTALIKKIIAFVPENTPLALFTNSDNVGTISLFCKLDFQVEESVSDAENVIMFFDQ